MLALTSLCGLSAAATNLALAPEQQTGKQQQSSKQAGKLHPGDKYYDWDDYGRPVLKTVGLDPGAVAGTCQKIRFNVTLMGEGYSQETDTFDITLHDVEYDSYGTPFNMKSKLFQDLLEDEPVLHANTRGTVSFASAGPKSRSTQLFVNIADNSRLDNSGFSSPFGEIDEAGMKVVEKLYAGYGEAAPKGIGPDQLRIHKEGNDYLKRYFAWLSYINWAKCI